MTDDGQLLQQYTRERSESAFRDLVTRHIDLVYSAALRVAGGDRPLAEDVTQMVFIDLARKAWSLSPDILLAGWLHRHTCFVAAKAVRTERRRKAREHTATEMSALDNNTDSTWDLIAPHLDEGLNQLSAPDREAIVLRFLKRQDLRAVGAALGISEDAAQKRVSRALEKLRGVLSRRGVTLAAATLSSMLAAEAVTAAPAALAISVTAASLAAAAPVGISIGLTTMKLMAQTKLHIGLAGALIITSVVTPLVLQYQAKARLRDQDEVWRQQTDQLAKLQADNERLSNLLARRRSSPSPSNDQSAELLRLRGEVGRLRRDVQSLTQPKPTTAMSRNEMLASFAQRYSERTSQLKQFLEANPSENIPEIQFLADTNWLWLAGQEMGYTEDGYRRVMSMARLRAEGKVVDNILRPALQQYAQENNGQFPSDLAQLTAYFKTPLDGALLKRWQILPGSKLDNRISQNLRNEDWVITQKAPVNRALDQRLVISLKDTFSFVAGPPDQWDTDP